METQYANIMTDLNSLHNDGMVDNSGLRIYYTPNLRANDAGVMSIGMQPNWRHIIPPGQDTVVSEGHCVEECTKRAFPKQGINIFAVMMRTHQIGKQVKLRHVSIFVCLTGMGLTFNTQPEIFWPIFFSLLKKST